MTFGSSLLSAVPGLRHAFFTREGGVSTGLYASLNGGVGSNDDAAHVTENRRRMAEHLGVQPTQFLTAFQIHSPDVAVATAPWDAASRPRADAMVTNVPGLAIGVTAADCGPVLFADPSARVIGAAHAGWKGAIAGVTDRTIEAMEALGARRDAISAAIGPTIAKTSYEIDEGFRARFLAVDSANARFFESGKPGHWQFDLPAYVAARLVSAGLGQVETLNLDTYAAPDRFYSFRRATHRGEPAYGRQMSLIGLP